MTNTPTQISHSKAYMHWHRSPLFVFLSIVTKEFVLLFSSLSLAYMVYMRDSIWDSTVNLIE